jgi:Lysyl oxidase
VRGIRSARSRLVVALATPAALIAAYLFVAPAAYSTPAAQPALAAQRLPIPCTDPRGCPLPPADQPAPPAPAAQSLTVPCTDPRGCPDLIMNEQKLNNAKLVTQTFTPDDCVVQEGQVGAVGTRRLLTFPYSTPNLGPGALIIGDPYDPAINPLFEWGACHGHWHFKHYAAYRLWKPADFTKFQQLRAKNPDMLTKDIIANNGLNPILGTKRGFCVVDYARAPKEDFTGTRDPRTYLDCGATINGVVYHGNQGIGVGWADTYVRQLPGQWIDVTGVPDGNYILDVETNPDHIFQEGNYNNNEASKRVKVTGGMAP